MSIEYSIIIPCFNEGQVIYEVVANLKTFLDQQAEASFEIIVVDDCSTDDTPAILKRLEGIRVIRHPINRGYGASIKTGIRQAQGVFVATYDGDGQHNPADLLNLCRQIHSEDYALVIGARTKLLHSSLWRMPGKWFLGWVANFLSRTKIPDLGKAILLIGPVAMLVIAVTLALYEKLYLVIAGITPVTAFCIFLMYRYKKAWFYYYAVAIAVAAAIFYAWPRS
jgi:glycosyltransferase involved in cell wall biosynthesis